MTIDVAPGTDALTLDLQNDIYCPTAIIDGEGIPVYAHISASNMNGDAIAVNVADRANLTINSPTGPKLPVIAVHQSGVGSSAMIMRAPEERRLIAL
jgi:hypothetical protein